MYIRCGSCHGAVWLETGKMAAQQFSVTCSTCGKEYRPEGGRGAEEGNEGLADGARRLVRETNLDLPSAYSVLLGIMTLEEAWELGDPSSPACRTAAEEPPHSHAKMATYDPAFQPAVEAGLLTPLQAMQRGRRQNYASLLATRHRLSEEVALEVADNKLSALEAIRRRGPDPGPPVDLRVPAARPRSAVAWLVVGVAVAAVVILAVLHATRPTATAPHTVPDADVRSDQEGRVLQVSAKDPESVLAGYCAADRERRFEPIGVVPSAQDGPDSRLGLLHRVGRSGEILCIVMREDQARNRWVAGDGTVPVVPDTAPRAAALALERR